jgi:hypothetical protein
MIKTPNHKDLRHDAIFTILLRKHSGLAFDRGFDEDLVVPLEWQRAGLSLNAISEFFGPTR